MKSMKTALALAILAAFPMVQAQTGAPQTPASQRSMQHSQSSVQGWPLSSSARTASGTSAWDRLRYTWPSRPCSNAPTSRLATALGSPAHGS